MVFARGNVRRCYSCCVCVCVMVRLQFLCKSIIIEVVRP